jgi:hypothetical protein
MVSFGLTVIKRLKMNLPPKCAPGSEVSGLVCLEQPNPPSHFWVKFENILAIYKAIGFVPSHLTSEGGVDERDAVLRVGSPELKLEMASTIKAQGDPDPQARGAREKRWPHLNPSHQQTSSANGKHSLHQLDAAGYEAEPCRTPLCRPGREAT